MKCKECGSNEGSFWKGGLCNECLIKHKEERRNNELMKWLSEHKNKTLFDLKKEIQTGIWAKNNKGVLYCPYLQILRFDTDELKKLEKKLRIKLEIQKLEEKEEKIKIREIAEREVYGKPQTTRVPLNEKDKDVIFKLANNECSICGKKEGLHIHHKNKDATDNRISNLIVLCGVCHKKIHMNVR
jgi:ribosomal protein S14